MIFFSYSGKDTEIVDRYYFALKQTTRQKIWYASKMDVRETNWEKQIRRAIRRSNTIIFFVSSNTNFNLKVGFLNEEKQMLLNTIRRGNRKKVIACSISERYSYTDEFETDFFINSYQDILDFGIDEINESESFKKLESLINPSNRISKPRF